MTLGGRVAEEIIIKDISAGASGDIQAVTKRARLMVTEWGMSEKVGPISYASDKEVFIGRDMASHVSYSEQTAALIDQEISNIIEDGLKKARELLSKNKKLLDNMARLLVERETIFTEEVDMLMEGKSVEEIMEFMDNHEKTLSENPFERNSVIIKESQKKAKKSAQDAEKDLGEQNQQGEVQEVKEQPKKKAPKSNKKGAEEQPKSDAEKSEQTDQEQK